MKKTVLNKMGQMLAIVLLSFVAISAMAQTSSDDEFARELRFVEDLKVYNSQLNAQLTAQQQAMSEISQSITDSKSMEAQLSPLLGKMLSSLEAFVNADLPFHLDERKDGIASTKAMMLDSSFKTSDRFRSIMDLYTIETEYGNTYESYKAEINLDGESREVDMLRVGRLGLYYQTTDQRNSGMWDAAAKDYVALPEDMNRNIRKAIKVAAKTIAPELLSLPITAPEGK